VDSRGAAEKFEKFGNVLDDKSCFLIFLIWLKKPDILHSLYSTMQFDIAKNISIFPAERELVKLEAKQFPAIQRLLTGKFESM
jgi:hypothetical protein